MPIVATTKMIQAVDGAPLFVRYFEPVTECKTQVLLVHGYMEHSGRYNELAQTLVACGIGVVVGDLRGHGQSAGQRGYIADFADYLNDVTATFKTLQAPNKFILGHSTGGLVVLDWLQQHQLDIQGAVVTSPYVAPTTPERGLKGLVGWLAGRYMPRLSLPAGLNRQDLTHEKQIITAHAEDPLIFHTVNASWYREVTLAQQRVRHAYNIPYPLLYVFADADGVASPTANRCLASLIQSPDKTILERVGEYHEVLNEIKRQELYSVVLAWLLQRANKLDTAPQK